MKLITNNELLRSIYYLFEYKINTKKSNHVHQREEAFSQATPDTQQSRKGNCNARLKAGKSGPSLTLVQRPFKSLVVKYDHDLCMYSKLKDGGMGRVPDPFDYNLNSKR